MKTPNFVSTLSAILLLRLVSNAFGAVSKGGTTALFQQEQQQVRSAKKVNDADDIFPSADAYNAFAICKGQITKYRFPQLNAPTYQGGCVRYYRGVDMTGVVTEQHFFYTQGIKTACDCIAKCLRRPTTCTNWVYKHIFDAAKDGGRRSCTLYSSPNLPSNVTLAYDLANSVGFQVLEDGNNPQAGGLAPLTFANAANTIQDNFGVSGFVVQAANNLLYC